MDDRPRQRRVMTQRTTVPYACFSIAPRVATIAKPRASLATTIQMFNTNASSSSSSSSDASRRFDCVRGLFLFNRSCFPVAMRRSVLGQFVANATSVDDSARVDARWRRSTSTSMRRNANEDHNTTFVLRRLLGLERTCGEMTGRRAGARVTRGVRYEPSRSRRFERARAGNATARSTRAYSTSTNQRAGVYTRARRCVGAFDRRRRRCAPTSARRA